MVVATPAAIVVVHYRGCGVPDPPHGVVLSPRDYGRMLRLKRHVPSSVGRIFEAGLKWMIPTPVSDE